MEAFLLKTALADIEGARADASWHFNCIFAPLVCVSATCFTLSRFGEDVIGKSAARAFRLASIAVLPVAALSLLRTLLLNNAAVDIYCELTKKAA
jgi:hypothetical protein